MEKRNFLYLVLLGIVFVIPFVSAQFGGGDINNLLVRWEQLGFFAYILPFLLIFALVFAILNATQIFGDQKAISGIIALVVGLLSLQFGFVSVFFAEIFPRLGVGLAILLVLLLLGGLFVDPKKPGIMIGLLVIAMIIAIVVFVTTAGSLGWQQGYWWSENWPMIVLGAFILIVIGLIVGAANRQGGSWDVSQPWRGVFPVAGPPTR